MKSKSVMYDTSIYQVSDSFSKISSETTYKSLAFIEFLEECESLVNTKQANLDEKLNALYENDEEEGQIFEQHDHFYESSINESLRESFTLAATSYLFSQFEYLMFETARRTGELFNTEIRIDEYKNKCKANKKGISMALAFIQDYGKISMNDLTSQWSVIKQFQRIRNCIVHSNGIVKSNYKGLDIYASSKDGLSYEKSKNQIIIKKDYLIEMGNTCFGFLEKIMEKVWENRPMKDNK